MQRREITKDLSRIWCRMRRGRGQNSLARLSIIIIVIATAIC